MAPRRQSQPRPNGAVKLNTAFNKLISHKYCCSDFDATFLKGMFSCSACDDWCVRAVHGRRNKKASNQANLRTKRLKCQRLKRGRKLIQIQVLVGGAIVAGSNSVSAASSSALQNEFAANLLQGQTKRQV